MPRAKMHSPVTSRIDVTLESDGLISCVLHGHITEQLVKKSMQEALGKVKEARANGKAPRLLINAHNVLSQTSGARTQAKAIGQMGLEKIAIYGTGAALSLVVEYLIRSGGMVKYAKIFRTEAAARHWLKTNRVATGPTDKHWLRLLLGGIVILMGLMGLVGWAFNNEVMRAVVPGLKPANPVSIITWMLLAAGLIAVRRYGVGKGLTRLLPTLAGLWSLIFGLVLTFRAIMGVNIPIDMWLFTSALESDPSAGFASPRTGILFVTAGMMLLAIMTGQHKRWLRVVFQLSSGIGFVIAVGSLINYGFGLSGIFAAPSSLISAISFLLFNYALQSVSRQDRFSVRTYRGFNKYAPAIFVGSAMVLISGVAWQQSNSDMRRNIGTAIQQDFAAHEAAISDRIEGYVNTLRGFRSFFESSDEVSPAEFRNYFQTSELAQNYPGFTAVTLVQSVPASQRDAFNRQLRAYATPAFPNYAQSSVYPITDRAIMYPTTLVEPSLPTTLLGFDLNSNDTRRDALERARDTGTLAASDIIDLNAARNDPSLPKRPGFYLSLPVYAKGGQPTTVAERQQRIYGFVNALFESSRLFGNIFKNEKNPNVKYVVTNARSDEVLYAYNGGSKDIEPEVKYTKQLVIAGQIWKLEMYTTPAFRTTGLGLYMPTIILASGITLAALATLLMVMQTRRRDHAVMLAESMTEDLNNERNYAVATQQKDEAILTSIGDAVFAIDTEGHITLFNSAAEKITGYTKEEAIGQHYQKILHFVLERDGSVYDSFIRQALTGHLTSMKNHTLLIRKDGTKAAVADSAAPIRDAHDRILGAIVVFRDVTKENDLDRAKSEFVSLASHQLRTPLSAIGWYSEMLLNGDAGKLSKAQLEQVNEIYEGNQRMVELVNSLLDVSRLELGRLQNDAAPTSVIELMHSLRQEMEPTIASKQLNVKMDVASKLPEVKADPKLLRMIFQNLLSNAVKYTPAKGSVGVVMRLAADAADELDDVTLRQPLDRYIFLKVTDSGFGIPLKQQPRIFQKLFRADNVRAMDVEGTGLGLYIVREVVQKLGGKIWFRSSEGKGSTFYVVLPITTKSTVPKS